MKTIVKILTLGVVGLMPFAQGAVAADIIEPVYEQVPEIVPVEIGSGWYLRGDVSYDFKSKTDGNYRTFAVDPAGCGADCGTGYDTQDYDSWKIDSSADVGVGIGYQFTDYFRADLTAHYWQADVDGRNEGDNCALGFCGSVETSKASAWELMANAYVDLGTFAGFTPYIGGGLGAVNVDYDDFASTNFAAGQDFDTISLKGENSWRFAYALMAGASYDLTKSLKLDVGYRYVNVEDGDMFGFDDFTANLGARGVQGRDNGFDRHTITAGLRYSIF
jgi:opacity protein-like surface antigen